MIRYPYKYRTRRAARVRDWLLLVAMGLVLGAILSLSLAGCATVPVDTWCDGLPPVYGTDC